MLLMFDADLQMPLLTFQTTILKGLDIDATALSVIAAAAALIEISRNTVRRYVLCILGMGSEKDCTVFWNSAVRGVDNSELWNSDQTPSAGKGSFLYGAVWKYS